MLTPVVPGYELKRRLGRGGMGEVWLASRQAVGDLAKPVAIKVVALDPYAGEMGKQFLDEARVSMVLSHSNIVQVFDVGTTRDFGYLVMEVVDGVDLVHLRATLVASGTSLPLRVATHITGQLLRALEYAHSLRLHGSPLGIVHRDISPHNVLVSVSGEVKLLDFGIAKTSFDSTTGRHVRGKLKYMAPEQFAGQRVDARADLYAVGAVLYELLTGLELRAGSSPADLYREMLNPSLPTFPPELPAALSNLLGKLLQPEVGRRCASAAEALSLLSAWPGYGDASSELADLCRRVTGVDAPRAEAGSVSGPAPAPSYATDTGTGTLDGGATQGGGITAVTAPGVSTPVPPPTTGPVAPRRRSAPVAAVAVFAGVVLVSLALVGVVVFSAGSEDAGAADGAPAAHGEPSANGEPSVEAAETDRPRPGLAWLTEFCVVEAFGSPTALLGYAGSRPGDKPRRPTQRTIVDGRTGAVKKSFPVDETERGILCLAPDLLAVLHGPADADKNKVSSIEFVRPDGSRVATRKRRGGTYDGFTRRGRCLVIAGKDVLRPDGGDCGSAAEDVEIRTLLAHRCSVLYTSSGTTLDDGSVLLATNTKGAVTVTRSPSAADPPMWTKVLKYNDTTIGERLPLLVHAGMAVFVAVPEGTRRQVAVWIDVDTGDVKGETDLGKPPGGLARTDLSMPPMVLGDLVLIGRCEGPGLVALDPDDRSIRWSFR